MVFITGFESQEDFEILSGVLLAPVTEADYRRGLFSGFLISDAVREIACELPRYSGGHGTTRDGLFVGEFNSELLGVRKYTYKAPPSVLTDIVENRVRLITRSDVRNVNYPAFLSETLTSRPMAYSVTLAMQIRKLGELPEIQAFAARIPQILEEPETGGIIEKGSILPVHRVSGDGSFVGAMRVIEAFDSRQEVVIYHRSGEPKPCIGDIIQRAVTIRHPVESNSRLEFTAMLGTVIRA